MSSLLLGCCFFYTFSANKARTYMNIYAYTHTHIHISIYFSVYTENHEFYGHFLFLFRPAGLILSTPFPYLCLFSRKKETGSHHPQYMYLPNLPVCCTSRTRRPRPHSDSAAPVPGRTGLPSYSMCLRNGVLTKKAGTFCF